ncbi:hypothetical protein [Acetonema longum]|uniref:Uncharacterized protein n=1 Tax=Acetonema longum DSM 6540 TaxID=1009370 RepID=F7NE99_9FIRM|nr:hypothetical protein [Acetonema longum]EGO65611.1 hypothetical protein ALO_01809 [Acetonema longum DSM 6540]
MGKEGLGWWPLTEHLCDYAALQPELAGITVRAGNATSKAPYPCLEILWDKESSMALHGPAKGGVSLWLDLWAAGDDQNPAAAYETLYDLQSRVCDVLTRWSDAVWHDLNMVAKLSIAEINSDGDSHRPLAKSRMILNIDWRK